MLLILLLDKVLWFYLPQPHGSLYLCMYLVLCCIGRRLRCSDPDLVDSSQLPLKWFPARDQMVQLQIAVSKCRMQQ